MNIYIATYVNGGVPESLDEVAYVHIKGHVDGELTIVITLDPLVDPLLVEKTKEQAQAILDEWIDAENVSPPLDKEGNPILQSRINLEQFGC